MELDAIIDDAELIDAETLATLDEFDNAELDDRDYGEAWYNDRDFCQQDTEVFQD